MREERRDSERLALSAPVRYQKKGSQRFGNSIGRDINDSGIGFLSNEYFPISSQLIFETQHPCTHKCIRGLGEVVWVSSQPYSERFSVGARFIDPPVTIQT